MRMRWPSANGCKRGGRRLAIPQIPAAPRMPPDQGKILKFPSRWLTEISMSSATANPCNPEVFVRMSDCQNGKKRLASVAGGGENCPGASPPARSNAPLIRMNLLFINFRLISPKHSRALASTGMRSEGICEESMESPRREHGQNCNLLKTNGK